MKISLLAGVAFAAVTLAEPADAALLRYDITGNVSGSFLFDTATTPYVTTAFKVGYDGLAGTFNGVDRTISVEFQSADFGGFAAFNTGQLFTFFGPSLFDGPTSAPVFKTGTFTLNGFLGAGPLRLVVSKVAAAPVPELATWAMMIAGFGLAGGAMRVQRRRAYA